MKLFELKNEFDDAKFEQDCKFYLEQIGTSAKKIHMFRGTDSENRTLNGVNKFRERTRPLDMPINLHKNLNKFFTEKFNHPFRNGLFVSGDDVESYGQVRVIVPVGKFEWLSSKEFFDMFGAYEDAEMDADSPEEAEAQMLAAVVKSKKWIHNEKLAACIKNGNEIMLWCPEGYYMFNEDGFLPSAIRPK
jgi:hypothetical protein